MFKYIYILVLKAGIKKKYKLKNLSNLRAVFKLLYFKNKNAVKIEFYKILNNFIRSFHLIIIIRIPLL